MENLANKLRRLSEDAVCLYAKISGSAKVPERFVQHIVMANLCREDARYKARLEVNAAAFRDDLGVEEARAAYDRLTDVQPHFLDALLWLDGKLHSIVEFKLRDKVQRDIERMAKLLSLSNQFSFGYEVAVIVVKEWEFEGIINNMKRFASSLGNLCGPLHIGERFTLDDGKAWCCVCVIPVFPNNVLPPTDA